MALTNFSKNKPIPSVTTRKSSPVTVNFAKGIATYKPNDTMGADQILLAQDARFDRVGEYGTRKGFRAITEAIGDNSVSSNKDSTSTALRGDSAALQPYSFSASSNFRLYAIKVSARRLNDNYVVPKIIFKVKDGSTEEINCSLCIDDSELKSTMTEFTLVSMEAPTVLSGRSVEVSLGVQSGSLSDIEVKTNNSVLMTDVRTATTGSIKSVFEANIDGTKTILFQFNSSLYRANPLSGAVTKIRDLPSGAGKVRFNQDLNQIRYVDGAEKPHLLNPANGWSDSVIDVKDLKTNTDMNVTMTNIMDGVADNIIYFAKDPDTEALWTYPYGYTYAKSPAYTLVSSDPVYNQDYEVGHTLGMPKSQVQPSGCKVGDWISHYTWVAEVYSVTSTEVWVRVVDTTPQTISSYDKFSTDFYQNFPAIKTGDPLTAMFNLGGVLYFMTRRNKYQMYSQSAESWSQSASNAQNGTFSQESLVCDLNYAYFANDNGIYIFDGSSEVSLTENTIQNVYDAIPSKQSIVLELYKNRLYVFYTDNGVANNKCLVYNINLRVWESFDDNTYVSATSARQNSSAEFICGHSRLGFLMLAEDSDSNYADLSQPIGFNLNTSYQAFGTTSQLKRITKWRPEFASTEAPYTVQCGYALDYSDAVKYAFSVNLESQEYTRDEYIWDYPSDYGIETRDTKHTTIPQVNGEFYRCQIRYQHIAAFEPVIFRSHTLTVQTQRIR